MPNPSSVRQHSSLAARLTLLLSVTLAALFMTAFPRSAPANTAAPAALPVKLDDVGRGGLLFRTEEADLYLPAPELETDVEIDINGMVARATVRQRFHNPTDQWLEGVYVFPLPERAAVDRLRMRIGERFIEGKIEEKQRAKATYEQARAEGKKAALLEQERPNIFTASVANIGPDEAIVVEIQYQETIVLDDGQFSLRFPMVVGPRFIPGGVQVANFGGTGWAVGTDQVPDAARITPPVVRPEDGPINPVKLAVRLDAGFPLAEVKSHHHAVTVSEESEAGGTGHVRLIALKDGTVPADSDFELTWRPAVGDAPAAGLFSETVDGKRYLLVMVMPPDVGGETPTTTGARELIFVVDTSGSMAGESIRQAKAALQVALDQLRPGDSFNIIQFNSQTSALFGSAQPVDAGSLRTARAYIAALEGNGGTVMAPALELSLAGSRDTGRLRQIVFMTDGAVGNETALFDTIRTRLGNSRLFTVGIGSAPNSHFMRGAARHGRGTFTHIGQIDQVATRMQELFDKLSKPVLTDIRAYFPGAAAAEIAPDPIPDLYAGEPVVFAVALSADAERVVLDGRVGDARWRQTVTLDGGNAASGIAKLWARNRIAALEDAWLEGEDRAETDVAILQTALDFHLVSRLTSLVAVEVTPSRPDTEEVTTRPVPTNLPKGWEFDKVFGESGPAPSPEIRKAMQEQFRQAMTASAAPKLAALQNLAAAPSADAGAVALQDRSARFAAIPQTATPASLMLLTGLALLMLAWLMSYVARRRWVRT